MDAILIRASTRMRDAVQRNVEEWVIKGAINRELEDEILLPVLTITLKNSQ